MKVRLELEECQKIPEKALLTFDNIFMTNYYLRIAIILKNLKYYHYGFLNMTSKIEQPLQIIGQPYYGIGIPPEDFRSVNLEKKCGVVNSSKKRTKFTILSIFSFANMHRIVSFACFLEELRTPKIAFEINIKKKSRLQN